MTGRAGECNYSLFNQAVCISQQGRCCGQTVHLNTLGQLCLFTSQHYSGKRTPPALPQDAKGWSQKVSTSLITMSWIALKPMFESKGSFLNECHMYSVFRSNAWRFWANPQPLQEGRQESPQRGPRIARPGAHAAQEEAQEEA